MTDSTSSPGAGPKPTHYVVTAASLARLLNHELTGRKINLPMGTAIPVQFIEVCTEDHSAGVTRLADGQTLVLPELECCFLTAGGGWLAAEALEEQPND